MKITIAPDVFQKFHPQFTIAFLVVTGYDSGARLSEAKHLLQETEQVLRLTFNKNTLKSHQLISPWAVVQQEFGKEARHYQTSVERLLHQVLAGKRLAAPDALTAVVHYLSLKHLVPFGSDDLEKISGNVAFALASGREKVGVFSRLKKGALYYQDAQAVLGTKLDYWKNPKTALTSQSRAALIHIEALPPVTKKELRSLVKEAQQLIATFTGGKVAAFFLDRRKRTVSFHLAF